MKEDRKKSMSLDGAAQFGLGSNEVADRVYCRINGARKDGFLKLRIRSEMDERAFVRAVWIYLARQDAPLDVFDCDLDCVETIEHQVMMDTAKFEVKYETVSSKDGSSKTAECVVKSTACVENGKGRDEMFAFVDDSFGLGEQEASKATVSFDEDAFLESFDGMSADSVFPADIYEAERMGENAECRRQVAKKHDDDISTAIGKEIGEEYRVARLSAEPLERSARMYVAPEWYTTITYNGEVYTFKSFPFGGAKVSGDKIENEHSLASCADNRQKMYEAEKEKIQKSAAEEKSEWGRMPFVVSSILFAFFVVGAIAMSLFYAFNGAFTIWNGYSIGMLAGAVVAALLFVGAVVTFVINVVRKIRRDRAIDAKARDDIEAREEAAASAIEKFSASYKARQLKILNEKLELLDLEPVVAEMFCKRAEKIHL